ncbi:MAG: hypothetical protein MJY63_03315 [Paludibacteraceae bacterium]|nr:hypothetical protein [Paludibacteraceae bacterium]
MKRIRLTESQLHNVIRRCINEALGEGRKNRPLSDYQNDLNNQRREMSKNHLFGEPYSDDYYDVVRKSRQADKAQILHNLRNGDYPTAEFNGKVYTIDDPLPEDANVYFRPYNGCHHYSLYPEGESFRDAIKSTGLGLEDISEWYME